MEKPFHKEVMTVVSRNPEGSVKKDMLEIRRDPLTGHVARINVSRAKRPHVRSVETKEVRKNTLAICPFCKENWNKTLQGYAEEFLPKKFIQVGETILFPNKYPFGKHHSVLVLGGKHFHRLGEISPEIWKDAFMCIKTYVEKVIKFERWKNAYVYVNLNFLSPSGASIDHPHMQILVEKDPLTEHKHILENSKKFYRKRSTSYWRWLKKNCPKNLLIKKSNVLHLMAAFAPIANGEIVGVGKEKSLFEYTKKELDDLATFIAKLFQVLEKNGWRSMNMAIMFPKNRDEAAYFPTLLRIIKRPEPEAFYTADRGFIEVFYRESVIQILPEDLATSLRKLF